MFHAYVHVCTCHVISSCGEMVVGHTSVTIFGLGCQVKESTMFVLTEIAMTEVDRQDGPYGN